MPPSQGGSAEFVNRIFILPPSQDTSRPVLKTSFEGGSWGPSRSFQSGVLCVERGYSVANMKTKMQELETFLEKANVGLAQGSVLNTDSADAEVRATLEKRLEKRLTYHNQLLMFQTFCQLARKNFLKLGPWIFRTRPKNIEKAIYEFRTVFACN